MPKVFDPIPSRSFYVTVTGDDLESLTEIVNEARRLKPEWHDTPQSVISSIVEDFLGNAEAFDQFVLTRVDSEQRALLRQIAELKGLKRAVKSGTLEEAEQSESSGPASSKTGSTQKTPDLDSPSKANPPPLDAMSSAVK